jgi:hypothetical protein
MNISIYGIRKVKTINILQLYSKLNKGKKISWIDDFDFEKDFKKLKIKCYINDNMGILVKMSCK